MKPRIIPMLAVAAALWCGLAAELALAQPATTTDAEMRMYFPTGSSTAADPLRLEITVDVNGKPVTKLVEVAGISKWVKPDRAPSQNGPQYLQALADSAAIASQAKAEIILIRINQAFSAEFAQLDGGKGRLAEFGTYSQSLTFNPKPNSETKIIPAGPRDRLKADGEFGLVNIPNATKVRVVSERDRTGRVIRGNPTGEAGDGIRPVPRSGRVQGTMSRGIADVVTFATGLDPYGDPSFVTLGISGLYVASVLPTPGTTDDEILRELEALLDSNGILTTFDPFQVALSFDVPILDGQTVVWGTDDPGLDFGAAFEVIGVAPAPTSGTLIAAGLLALAAACRLRDTSRRRQRHLGSACVDPMAARPSHCPRP